MKKIIYYLGIFFLFIVIILNFIFTATLNSSEKILINYNNIFYIFGLMCGGLFLYFISNKINKKIENKFSNKIFIILLIIFLLLNSMWLICVNPSVVGDSVHVANMAQVFYRKNSDGLLSNLTYAKVPLSRYMEAYPHQITLAFIFSLFFKIIRYDFMEILRVINLIGNILIIFAIWKISQKLSKKYKNNNVLLSILIFTFISLPMLSTFIYGDIFGIALSLISVYFLMEYREKRKIKYCIFSAFSMMLAYMMRMNTLIFIIAGILYLIIDLFENKKYKENLLCIFLFLIIIFIPNSLVKNYYFNKYDLNNKNAYPLDGYFAMAMEESSRGNGWYNEKLARPGIESPQKMKILYLRIIKNRLNYFSNNLEYTFNFYINKIASMWTENTYSAVFNNIGKTKYDFLKNANNGIIFYQKILLIITCTCSLINLIKNKKNISLEIIFLLSIFVGGFAFHILWEAKSRYIIPYIIVLIPIASIEKEIKSDKI